MFKESIIYLSSSVLNRMTPFLMLPILTNYLTPAEYGVLSLFQVAISLSVAISGLSININIVRNFFRVDKLEMSAYIHNMLLVLVVSNFLFFFGVQIASIFLESPFGLPLRWLQVLPILAFMSMVNMVNITLLRTMQRAWLYAAFEVSHTLVNLCLSLWFVIGLNLGWDGRALGVSITLILYGAFSLAFIYKLGYLQWAPDKAKIIDLLTVSLPLIPHGLSAVVITASDRFFIESMINTQAVGIYSVAYSFGMVVMLFTESFVKAWSPWFFRKLVEPTFSDKQTIILYTRVYLILVLVGAIIYSQVAQWVLPHVVNQEFYGASDFIFWVCLGYAAYGAYQIFFPYLVHIKKTHLLAFSSTFAALINLIGNYFFINAYGAIGAAYSTFVAYVVSAILVFWFASKTYPMPWFGQTDQLGINQEGGC